MPLKIGIVIPFSLVPGNYKPACALYLGAGKAEAPHLNSDEPNHRASNCLAPLHALSGPTSYLNPTLARLTRSHRTQLKTSHLGPTRTPTTRTHSPHARRALPILTDDTSHLHPSRTRRCEPLPLVPDGPSPAASCLLVSPPTTRALSLLSRPLQTHCATSGPTRPTYHGHTREREGKNVEPDIAYLEYLSRYQPAVFERWMHLIKKHPRLADRDCGCTGLVENREDWPEEKRAGYGLQSD